MFNLTWSPSEKKIARAAFDHALAVANEKRLAEFKAKASAVTSADDLWKIEEALREDRETFDKMFDYRYSQLPVVFAWTIREGYLEDSAIAGLSEDKRDIIRRMVETKWER